MSSSTLVLSHLAEADLREIWIFSYDRWGEAQADRYLDDLERALRACEDDPEGGRARDEVRGGYWSRLAQKHVIFYTIAQNEILVQRILHTSMDPDLHIPDVDVEP